MSSSSLPDPMSGNTVAAESSSAKSRAMNSGLDPFVDAHSDKSYFVTPALRQRIDLLRHLIEFGRQIVVLTGPPGAGKSALLDRVADTHEKNWHVLRYVAGPTLNHATLLGKIASELGIDRAIGDEAALVDAIRKKVIAANQRGETTILTIDNAHALPADTYSCLTGLAHCVEESAELKVLLSADPAHSPLIDQLQSATSQHALVHVVEVPRLDGGQTQAMLTHRWNAAYGNDEIPLDAAEMAQIYQQSNGIPGKAIVLARQVQVLTGNPERPRRDPAQRYLVGGVAIIVLFVIFAFFNAGDPGVGQETRIELELKPEPITEPITGIKPLAEPPLRQIKAPPSPPETTIEPRDSATSDSVSVTPPSPPAVKMAVPAGERSKPSPKTIIAESDKSPPTGPTVSPLTVPSSIEASPIPLAGADAISRPAVTTAKTPPSPAAKPTVAERYSVEWLRSHSGNGYVLQLFGVRDRAAAMKFIKQRRISGKSAVFVTQHEGAPWYAVVYGYYPDRAAARAAIIDLPVELATTKPWARAVESLR